MKNQERNNDVKKAGISLTTSSFINNYSNIREEMLSATSLEELEYIRKKYMNEIDNIYLPIFEDMVNNGHHFEKDIGKVIN